MKEFKLREQVRKIENRFQVGSNVILVAPARIFIKEGYMKKVSRKKDIKYLFILFSDILLYCSELKKSLKLHQRLSLDIYCILKYWPSITIANTATNVLRYTAQENRFFVIVKMWTFEMNG